MRVGIDASGTLGRVRAGMISARLGVWIRLLWLLVVLFGFTVLLLVIPELWRTVSTPCLEAPCKPGQPTVEGLELLARIGLPPSIYSGLFMILGLLMSALIPLVMGVVLWKKPRDLVVVSLAFGGVTCSFMGALGIAGWRWLELPQHIFGVVAGSGLAFGLLAFPDGRFVPRWGRWLAYPLVLASLLTFVPASWGGAVAGSAFLLSFPCAFVLLLLRYRRSDYAVQLQLKWVLYGIGTMVLATLDSVLLGRLLPAPWNAPGAPGDIVTALLGVGSIVFFWLCLAVSVYRYNLFDIDLVIRRTLIYGVLTTVVTGGYLLLSVGIPLLLHGSEEALAWYLAVVPAVLVIKPLHGFLARQMLQVVPPRRVDHAEVAPRPVSWVRTLLWGYGFFVLALLFAGIPAGLRVRTLPCTGALCEVQGGRLSAEQAAALGAVGLEASTYAAWTLGAALLVPLFGFVLFALTLQRARGGFVVPLLALGIFSCNAKYPGTLSALAESRPWVNYVDGFLVFVAAALLLPTFFAFPDGRFVPRWSRWLILPNILVALGMVLALSPQLLPGSQSLLAQPWLAQVGVPLLGGWNISLGVLALACLIYRYCRLESSAARRQIRWVLFGLVVSTVLGFALEALGQVAGSVPRLYLLLDTASTLNILFFMTCLALAMLTDNLFDVGMVMRRTLLYSGLMLGVLMLYGAFVVGAGLLGLESGSLLASLLAALTVALAIHPLRSRLQRGVNRLLYGQRSEPYEIVSSLTERLAGLLEPAQVFPVTVETVARALKLPFAEIALGPEGHVVASFGTTVGQVEHMPLHYAGQDVGRLSVSPREGETQLSRADRRLLTDLAGQVSVSAHAYVLGADLERSRLRLVSAREEARRQLGNDLHDSVGHALAGLMRRAEMASNLLERDPVRAKELLSDLAEGSRAAATQVRALAHSLHPPELELLGLVGAVRETVEGGVVDEGSTGVQVTLSAEELPRLPAAVEVAAYYTVREALHNVYRHAHARHAWVRLERCEHVTLGWRTLETPVLVLEISDDGRGLTVQDCPGLGLRSMQGRAAELGGRCTVTAREGGGTRVLAQLPLLEP